MAFVDGVHLNNGVVLLYLNSQMESIKSHDHRSISIHNETTTPKSFHDATTLAVTAAGFSICKIFFHAYVFTFTVTAALHGRGGEGRGRGREGE